MTIIANAIRELCGLFVEDASFTLGILACLVVAAFVFPITNLPPMWRGLGLFALLAAALVENTRRSARRIERSDHMEK